jgi:inositol transport system substrate-binding protein
MKTGKKLLAMLFVLVMILGLLGGCASNTDSVDTQEDSSASDAEKEDGANGDALSVGFTNMADTDVFCKYAMDKFVGMAEAEGWEVSTADAANDTAKQVSQVENFIAMEVDYIVIEAVDSDAIVPAIKEANAAEIPVICLICDANGGEFTYVGSDNYQCGKAIGEYFHDILPENAKIVFLAGTAGLNHSTLRHDGFFENLNRDDVTVLADIDCDFERETAMKTMTDLLQANEQIDAVVSANDQMALGAIQALKAAGREGVLVNGVDATEDAMASIKAGDMTFSMLYNGIVQAQNTVDVIKAFENGETVEERIISEFEVVDSSNVDEYSETIYGS